MRLSLVLILTALPSSLGFSTGGGATGSEQTCEAIDICPHDYAGRPQCPGMLLVGGPTRSGLEPGKEKLSPRDPTYTIRTADVSSGGMADPSTDTMTFSPGSLVKIYVRVNKRFVKRRRVDEGIAGLCICFHNKQVRDAHTTFFLFSTSRRAHTVHPPLALPRAEHQSARLPYSL